MCGDSAFGSSIRRRRGRGVVRSFHARRNRQPGAMRGNGKGGSEGSVDVDQPLAELQFGEESAWRGGGGDVAVKDDGVVVDAVLAL